MSKEVKKYVQVMFELGHEARFRQEPTVEGYTHDWTVYIRGARGADIHHFVEKVVFFLHESFAKPKRVIKEPPYEVSESGYASFILPIEVHYKRDARVSKFQYDLVLMVEHHKPTMKTIMQGVIFRNPNDDLEKLLIKGGAQFLKEEDVAKSKARPSSPPHNSHDNGEKKGKDVVPVLKEKSGKKPGDKVKPLLSSPSPASSLGSNMSSSPTNPPSSRDKPASLSPRAHDLNQKKHMSSTSSSQKTKNKNDTTQSKPKKSSMTTSVNSANKKRKRSVSPPVSLSPFTCSSTSSSLSSASSSSSVDTISQSTKKTDKKKSDANHEPGKKEVKQKSKTNNIPSKTVESKLNHRKKMKVEAESEIKKVKGKSSHSTSSGKGKLLKEVNVEESTGEGKANTLKAEHELVVNKKEGEGKEKVKHKEGSKPKEKTMKGKPKTQGEHKLKKEGKGKEGKCDTDGMENHSDSLKRKKKKKVKGEDVNGSVVGGGKQRPGASLSLIQEQRYYSELADLQKRLSECRDRARLQRVVNIVAETGLFTISETTLDFDLVKLDEGVVKRLWRCFE